MDKEDKLKFDDIPILQDFSDVFPKEIRELSRKRDMDFAIESITGAILNSNAHYRMNILDDQVI